MRATGESTFARNGKNSLYNTTSKEYGSPWVQDNVRPELINIKTDKIPTYSEIVGSINDFKRAEKLIKSKIVKETLEKEGINPHVENTLYQKKTEFHVKGEAYNYPSHGLNIGNPIYHTNNMNYGKSKPAEFQIQQKYFPCNNTFTQTFNGGCYRFNGLNTIKTISGVHNGLNDM